MECKKTSSFRYKRKVNVKKWLNELYDGNFGIHRCTLSNDDCGVIHIHDTDTKEHIVSFVRDVLYTNNSSFI